jgi:uracil-DNA glycosylase family 4
MNCPLKDNIFVAPDDSEIRTETGFSKCNQLWLGMHPGKEEVSGGKPFTGPAGKLLHGVINGLGFDSNVFFNAVPCEPSDNNGTNEVARKRCEPGVTALIEKYDPDIIIGMGEEGQKTSGAYREEGQVLASHGVVTKNVNNRAVLSSVHPAYVVRPTGVRFYQEFVDGIYHGINNYHNPIKFPNLVVIPPDEEKFKEIISKIPSGTKIGLDIETESLRLYERILCFQISFEDGNSYVIEWPDDITMDYNFSELHWDITVPNHRKDFYDTVKAFLEDPNNHFVLQGGMFDSPQFGCYNIRLIIKDDTLYQSHLVNENARAHGLKYQARLRLSWPNWDQPLDTYIKSVTKTKKEKEAFNWGMIPKDMLYKYAAIDPVATTELDVIGHEEMVEETLWTYNTISMPALNMFTDIRTRGIRIHTQRARKLAEDVRDEAAKVYKERILPIAIEYGMPDLNANSGIACSELLYERMGITPPMDRGKPVRSTNKKLMELLPQLDIISAITEFRELMHDFSTYYMGTVNHIYPDLCIHPYFNLTLVTGRLSATDPSILNIKKDSKAGSIFIPYDPRDYIILKIDQAQFELRVFAGLTNAEQMIQIFLNDIDIHGEFAKLINPTVDANVLRTDGGYRTRTKNVVFGKLYNAGDFQNAISMRKSALDELKRNNFTRYTTITESSKQGEFEYNRWFKELLEESKRIGKAFEDLVPEAEEFRDDIRNQMRANGLIQTVTGRQRNCPLLPNDPQAMKHLVNQMINSPVQGPASDLNLLSMLDIYNHYYGSSKAYPVTPVHDAIILEVHKAHWKEVLSQSVDYMTTAPTRYIGDKYPLFNDIPFKVEAEIGPNWKDLSEVSWEDGDWKIKNPEVLAGIL